MSKINDFCLIGGDLNLLVTASADRQLRIYKVLVKGKESLKTVVASEVGDVKLELVSSLINESSSRSLQLTFDKRRSMLLVLSSDNKLEIFKVNTDKPEAILKKLVKLEKKMALKRSHAEKEDGNDSACDEPLKKTVDKAKLA